MNAERQPGSRLPGDPGYWETLAERSVDAAFRDSLASSAPAGTWWGALSDVSFVLATSAVLALVGGALLLGERSPDAATDSHALTVTLAPDDPLLGSLLRAAAGPPPASALLTLIALREEQR